MGPKTVRKTSRGKSRCGAYDLQPYYQITPWYNFYQKGPLKCICQQHTDSRLFYQTKAANDSSCAAPELPGQIGKIYTVVPPILYLCKHGYRRGRAAEVLANVDFLRGRGYALRDSLSRHWRVGRLPLLLNCCSQGAYITHHEYSACIVPATGMPLSLFVFFWPQTHGTLIILGIFASIAGCTNRVRYIHLSKDPLKPPGFRGTLWQSDELFLIQPQKTTQFCLHFTDLYCAGILVSKKEFHRILESLFELDFNKKSNQK